MAIDEALSLESMAHNGYLRGPRTMGSPELNDREEYIEVRIQSPLLYVYSWKCIVFWENLKVELIAARLA
ncbi:hypothetical protein RRF57_004618 [Xylaria bambusicola]|uniref:Uncharacterized protein n=1 Tax=Xylaria bambusicola TaxID=326684 RepID=A0AAN7UGR3_9PEZI